MGWTCRRLGAVIIGVAAAAVATAPGSNADDGWVAVANSPNHEQQDWAFGPDQATAEANALAQCAVLQRADDCRVLAVSTDCVATAWDVSEPLNQIYAGSGGGPEAAIRGAVTAVDLVRGIRRWARLVSAGDKRCRGRRRREAPYLLLDMLR